MSIWECVAFSLCSPFFLSFFLFICVSLLFIHLSVYFILYCEDLFLLRLCYFTPVLHPVSQIVIFLIELTSALLPFSWGLYLLSFIFAFKCPWIYLVVFLYLVFLCFGMLSEFWTLLPFLLCYSKQLKFLVFSTHLPAPVVCISGLLRTFFQTNMTTVSSMLM